MGRSVAVSDAGGDGLPHLSILQLAGWSGISGIAQCCDPQRQPDVVEQVEGLVEADFVQRDVVEGELVHGLLLSATRAWRVRRRPARATGRCRAARTR